MRGNIWKYIEKDDGFDCPMCRGFGDVVVEDAKKPGWHIRKPGWTCPACQGLARGSRTLEELLDELVSVDRRDDDDDEAP
jgi:hypothetical protein